MNRKSQRKKKEEYFDVNMGYFSKLGTIVRERREGLGFSKAAIARALSDIMHGSSGLYKSVASVSNFFYNVECGKMFANGPRAKILNLIRVA
jgi:hypothetical protein